MKKLLMISMVLALVSLNAYTAYAGTDTETQALQVKVQAAESLQIEVNTDTQFTSFGSGTVTWGNTTAIDPSIGDHIAPDGVTDAIRQTKSDVAVICKHNGPAANWFFKIHNSGTELQNNIRFHLGDAAYNRNYSPSKKTNSAFEGPGTTAPGLSWDKVPTSATLLYRSATTDDVPNDEVKDTKNTPLGTWIGINYALDPIGLELNTTYNGQITYTLTTV